MKTGHYVICSVLITMSFRLKLQTKFEAESDYFFLHAPPPHGCLAAESHSGVPRIDSGTPCRGVVQLSCQAPRACNWASRTRKVNAKSHSCVRGASHSQSPFRDERVMKSQKTGKDKLLVPKEIVFCK